MAVRGQDAGPVREAAAAAQCLRRRDGGVPATAESEAENEKAPRWSPGLFA